MKVKRYQNRKLYANGVYINISDILDVVRQGEEVQVIDDVTQADITNLVLKRGLELVEVDTQILISLIKHGEKKV